MTRFDESSWIKPRLEYTAIPERYVFSVSRQTKDLIDIIAEGGLLFQPPLMRERIAHEAMNILLDREIVASMLSMKRLCSEVRRTATKTRFFHLTGIYAQNRSNGRSIIVQLTIDETESNCSCQLRDAIPKAKAVLREYKILKDKHQRELAAKAEHAVDVAIPFLPDVGPRHPGVNDLDLTLRMASFVKPKGKSTRTREREIVDEVSLSEFNIPRDGRLQCLQGSTKSHNDAFVVEWEPRGTSIPPLEILAAVKKLLPNAHLKPLIDAISPPKLDYDTTLSHQAPVDWRLDILESNEIADRLPRPRDDEMESIHENGFEAIAWYQPFHKFSERQWGIYFYAPMLDSMASIFALQLRGSEPRAYEIGELLAFHLVLQHELFHARLEFAASFHELAARRAGYLSYDKNVYDHFRGSQYWKEEALANWTAMQWLLGELPRWVARGLVQSPPNVLSCIESSFAEQPDGYRHWKSGDDPRTWQFLANEFVTGRPTKTVPKRPSPIEGALRSRDLIELRERDVPLHFVGRGVIADRLFSAPSRREAVRLLKHFGYEFDETGKGSHEIWRNASGVHFSLPKNDPLSVGVFHGLLKHLALTKNKYLQEVRLKL